MNEQHHNTDFPSDSIEDLVRRQKAPSPSGDFIDRCLATIPPAAASRRNCSNPMGHRFICVDCGVEASITSRLSRRTLLAALTGMTAVAAVLMMMVIIERSWQGPHVAVSNNAVPTTVQPHDRTYGVSWPAAGIATQRPESHEDASDSLLSLRMGLLRHGATSRHHQAATGAIAVSSKERAPGNWELLYRLLDEKTARDL